MLMFLFQEILKDNIIRMMKTDIKSLHSLVPGFGTHYFIPNIKRVTPTEKQYSC